MPPLENARELPSKWPLQGKASQLQGDWHSGWTSPTAALRRAASREPSQRAATTSNFQLWHGSLPLRPGRGQHEAAA
eukprot:CAMPEP_0179143886 /NCGR_PEP_ID=MMETSP0796-20121207/69250_1 /TAXON_ID=73915 /ORGANISM="Pyrodinium bahamense, Strain pbaha01" /LENGTH=76 /DNA_ID=CAMNT_0020843989 /DNA_START=30 /DNA_END=257 /DNA_ORIENTATION=+